MNYLHLPILVLLGCLTPLALHAQTPQKTPPASQSQALTPESLHYFSSATYREFNQPQFNAELHTPNRPWGLEALLSGEVPFEMRLTVSAKSIGSRSFRRYWLEGIAINNSDTELLKANPALLEFNELFKGRLLKGDDFRVRFTPNEQTLIILNGITLQSRPKCNFAPMLLSSWLGDIPLSQSFKQALLTKQSVSLAQSPSDLKQASYSKSRQRVIEGWLQPAPSVRVARAPKVIALNIDSAELNATTENSAEAPLKPATSTAATEKLIATEAAAEDAQLLAEISSLPTPQAGIKQESEMQLALRQSYYKSLAQHLKKYQTTPYMAFQRQWEGSVRLMVKINRAGEVINHRLLHKDRRQVFNNSALDSLKRAAPFPEVPKQLKDMVFSFTVPLNYRIR